MRTAGEIQNDCRRAWLTHSWKSSSLELKRKNFMSKPRFKSMTKLTFLSVWHVFSEILGCYWSRCLDMTPTYRAGSNANWISRRSSYMHTKWTLKSVNSYTCWSTAHTVQQSHIPIRIVRVINPYNRSSARMRIYEESWETVEDTVIPGTWFLWKSTAYTFENTVSTPTCHSYTVISWHIPPCTEKWKGNLKRFRPLLNDFQ